MRVLCDSSVLIAALLPSEDHHMACAAVLTRSDAVVVHVHALNETFATLTGGSLGFRVDADLTACLIREQIIARATMIVLDAEEVTAALGKARAHGVRGGAVYDYTRTPLLKKVVLRGEFGVMGVCEHNPDSAHRTKR